MNKWKKWLSVSLLTAMLGTACVAGAAVEVSANAGNRPSSGVGNLSPNEQVPSVGSSSAKKVSPNAWKKIDGVCYNGSGKVIEPLQEELMFPNGRTRLTGQKLRTIWILLLYVFPMEPNIWIIISIII